ncbi:MAG TPA: ATP-binding protein [Abditibacteriaceae bacterium]|jgi:PAS domain S-box-containing protein
MTVNILLVDDRPENLLALRAILDPLGCNFVEARSGVEALRHLLDYEFALILMDVQMPVMDGFEAASLIKQREKNRHVPIIFVTAISTEQHYIFKGYSAGAVDYIAKPFDADILRSKVAVFVDLWKKSAQIEAQAKQLREAELRELASVMENRRLSELAESEAKLSQFKSLLDATLDSVLIFEPESLRYTYVNHGAMRHLGYDCEELMDMRPIDIKPSVTEAQYRSMLEPLRSGEKASLTFEIEHQRKDGTLVPVEVMLQYITLPGDGSSFVSIVRDISERKRAQEALIAAKDVAERERERAERANRAKSEFIASVSHELRTPLNAILGFSKLLLNPRIGPLNEDQQSYVGDVVQSSEHLLHLINDILDLSKIEAGKMTLDRSDFVLKDVLEQSLAAMREEARSQNLALDLEIAPEIAALENVSGDERKVRQVMYNLLSNAVKFTPAGGSIKVKSWRESSPDGEVAVVSVCDTGVGIAAEDQSRIFAAFEQVDGSYARERPGTGLGLAITHSIVELHGGKITLESEEGKGSVFTFCLPLQMESTVSAVMSVGSNVESIKDTPPEKAKPAKTIARRKVKARA